MKNSVSASPRPFIIEEEEREGEAWIIEKEKNQSDEGYLMEAKGEKINKQPSNYIVFKEPGVLFFFLKKTIF